MRNFQEEADKAQSPKVTHVSIFGRRVQRRVAYRAILGLATILAIIAMLLAVVITSGSRSSGTTTVTPKVVVVLAPGLNPLVLESAMSSNKAPNMAMLSSSGGAYGRVASNATDTTAALVSILTGSPVSYHNVSNATSLSAFYNGASSFLRSARTASLRTTTIASAKYYSTGGTASGSANCNVIGVLDVECVGYACSGADSVSYCNALTKFIVADDNTALMGTTIATAFGDTSDSRELTLVLTGALEGNRAHDDNSLSALSNAALLDGVVGQILVQVAQRSYVNSENWLIVVAGDGVNTAQQAPLFVAAYANGAASSLSPINTVNGNVVDVFTTALTWLGIPNPVGVVGRAEGICHDGTTTTACLR